MKRTIEPELVAWLDRKIAANTATGAAAMNAIDARDARTLFRIAAGVCVGIRESGGNNRGPLVELLQRTIGEAEGEAWCMAFVQSLLAYAELKTGVLSWVAAGEHCLTVWRETPRAARVKVNPLPGAIAIWRKGKTGSGHTGILVSIAPEKNTMQLIEGNTESGVAGGEVVRDGGGVYLTRRAIRSAGTMQLLGHLIPFEPAKK
jgi:hypothetical protein